MRAQAKHVRPEEEEESVFISMTDMTVGFLFIMMILLAFFASQMQDDEVVSKTEFDRVVIERNEWRELAESRVETIRRHEVRITNLELQQIALVEQIETLDAQRAELESSLTAAHGQIEELERLVHELRQQILVKDEEIARLQEEIDRLQEVDPLEAYLARVSQVRHEILVRLRDAIRADFPDLVVELSEESDALRFQGEGLFASGRSDLTGDRRDIVARLARRLDEVLPCYTLGPSSQFDPSCNAGFVMIEAVQIEGHTDNLGSDELNRNLSAARANNTFFAMTRAAQDVMDHRNLKLQPVLSVAAYGPDRPVTSNDTVEGRATNRRIDLRFIMVTPQSTEGIEVIRRALHEVEGAP